MIYTHKISLALQSKIVVYAAIAAMLAMMGGIVLYASLDNPELELAKVDLVGIEVVSVDKISGTLKLETTFLVSNEGNKTFTVSLISYEIFTSGSPIASGQYSTVDIAMPGRATFYPDAKIALKSSTTVAKENINSELYNALVNGELDNYSAEGIITVESAWSVVEKEFQTSI